jgi:transcriptional antiterminator RfaH
MTPFWAVAQIVPQRERIALNMLARANFETYAPRLREWRPMRGGRQRQCESALFPGYVFLHIQLQWHAARWCPGVRRLVMNGLHPAKVSDDVVAEIRGRERGGVIEIARRQLKAGDRVKILSGPFRDHLAIYSGMSGAQRVMVLLQILGGATRISLARKDIDVHAL